MQISSEVTPIAGSLLSVRRLLDDAFAEDGYSFSAQGISLDSPARDSFDAELLDIKERVINAWCQGWCEYHETAKSRGRPPVRAAYFIRVKFSDARINADCVHKFFTLLLTRTKSTQYGRFLIVINNFSNDSVVSIVLHPVSLDGRMIRLEKNFPREFHRRIEAVFHSDPQWVVKAWLSS